ncbi:type II toxin-antitoxin system RelE/ParE family toxin [Hydrogenimonas thermophila]|uniref:type II toxin-antitoxin system RelE family toxin n=1 Tax=Hydrogenimonas thermophila TaxID=223786 RepID=UPI002936F5E8|nr:type II toxin-antitoxin system RelE/ParE family toxin [Hydrogenimonas thermophila]WOE69151.1 type II toxin-antitoxin system RelE/ParE family toxin [Hydrogenimonas thermophila]WOE71661.1 type II toxin-antitoxin system RelE/ParE family toxin [Hydrogenimonas thermophila]
MRIVVRKSAAKDIQKIAEPHKTKIKLQIQELQNFPNISNIKKLKNHQPAFRLRVGDYRVLFDVEDDLIIVARIKHRKEAY